MLAAFLLTIKVWGAPLASVAIASATRLSFELSAMARSAASQLDSAKKLGIKLPLPTKTGNQAADDQAMAQHSCFLDMVTAMCQNRKLVMLVYAEYKKSEGHGVFS